jgi:hypothetical protein
MLEFMKTGGLTLGLVVVGALVLGIVLGACQTLSRSEEKVGIVSSPAPKQASAAAIPPLDTEVPRDIATATFALG